VLTAVGSTVYFSAPGDGGEQTSSSGKTDGNDARGPTLVKIINPNRIHVDVQHGLRWDRRSISRPRRASHGNRAVAVPNGSAAGKRSWCRDLWPGESSGAAGGILNTAGGILFVPRPADGPCTAANFFRLR